MRFTKSLLVAAALVGATTATTKAYDLYDSNWNYSQPSMNFSESIGNDYWDTEWATLTSPRNSFFLFSPNTNETDLVNAGVYRGIQGSFSWSGNEYDNWPSYDPAYVDGELVTGVAGVFSADYRYDFDSGNFTSGTYFFDSRDTTTNLAIGQNAYGIDYDTDGDNGGSSVSGELTVYEREVQVARTGSGDQGANAFTAFQFDNSETLSGTFYNGTTFIGRNVLPTAYAFSDGEGNYGPSLAGSVVVVADIALGFFDDEGLFAKDGGWLDIRGDLTLGADGTIYIRDGEITSNIYTHYYTPGTYDIAGRLAIETGILSVREYFAQDMIATWNQTLGFRDGAENDNRLVLQGMGYGFDGEGFFGPEGSSFGALRSITGDNVQNGNISVIGDGEGFGPFIDGAVIGTDVGSTLTINGTINGLNSENTEGGADLGYNSIGNTTQNGRILSGINNVYKLGTGELLINSSNTFTGNLEVEEGSVRITNSGALAGDSGDTFVESGASLVLDVVSPATGLSLVDDIHITGTGQVGVGGALHNKSGTNSTTGNLWVIDGDDIADLPASGTVTVAASSSLTVANLRGGSTSNTITIDVAGSGLTAGAFNVLGNTGALDNIIKNGSGNAEINQLSSELDDLRVNAGFMLIKGSEDSAADNIYDQLEIFGTVDGTNTSIGSVEIRGNHHYGEFDTTDINVLIKGNITVHYNYDGDDIDLNNYSVVTLDAGATFNTTGFDVDEWSVGGDLEENSKFIIKGTFNALDDTFLDLDDDATLDIRAGGVVNSRVVADDDSIVTIAAADGEGLAAGVLNGNVEAYDRATITLNGVINGDVETYGNATLTLGANAVHNGDYDTYGNSTIIINGTIDDNEDNSFGQNINLSGNGTLKGSGTIGGDLTQTGGRVAPGNSTDVLTVLGNYSINAGSLQIEIGGTEGPGNDPDGNDQLAVNGTVTVGGTAVLDFEPYNGYESTRGGVFQILATDTGAARATIGTFDTVDLTGLTARVLFDHSTGKAYGTNLIKGVNGDTFAFYGAGNANRSEIGRALWMESIALDNSEEDDNYGSGVILDPLEEFENDGQKVFILTQTNEDSGEEESTALGSAAVSVLAAADVGAALDALSPEAFVGISELGVRVTRNFAQLPATKRKLAATNEWDFSIGYAGEQITSDGTSAYNSYKVSSDQVHLTAARDLSANLRLTLAAGIDDGEVGAAGFSADTDTQAFGLGLSFIPASKGWTADLGVALTRTDWTAARGAAQTQQDNQDGLGVALRVSLAPTVDGALSYAPYLGLSFATQDMGSVSEDATAAGVGVGFDGYERDSLVSELGLKAEYAVKPGTTITGVVAWEHDFENSGETTLNNVEFTDDGVTDTRFAVTSTGFGADIFRVGVGVRVDLGAKAAFSLGYDALISSESKSGQGIKADVAFRF